MPVERMTALNVLALLADSEVPLPTLAKAVAADMRLSLALTRARMCGALGQTVGAASPGTWFMAGLFSTLDILFDAPLHQLLSALPLSPSVAHAITNRSGVLVESLDAIVAFERGDSSAARCQRLTPDDFTRAFRTALDWNASMGGGGCWTLGLEARQTVSEGWPANRSSWSVRM